MLLQGTPGDVLPGIGVLHAVGPSTKPETDPVFTAEATNLLGAGIYRLSRQRGGTGFAAATTKGLLERPSGSGPQMTWIAATGVPTGKAGARCRAPTSSGPRPSAPSWAGCGRRCSGPTAGRSSCGGAPRGPTPSPRWSCRRGPAPRARDRLALTGSPSGDVVGCSATARGVWRVDATVDTPAGVLVGSVPPRLWGS